MNRHITNRSDMKVLILKDNYNSFERYYLYNLEQKNCHAVFYYKNSNILRKIFTHYGLYFESLWYGDWKNKLNDYDCIIVFDSLHSSNLLKYIRKRYNNRLIFWHWNPIKTDKDKHIFNETKAICEHWTFNPEDEKKYGMKLNNQFFFYQKEKYIQKENSAFFVGTDKGRYEKILSVAKMLETVDFKIDFHIIGEKEDGRRYIESTFMDYNKVLKHIQKSKVVLEIVQNGQNGLTARSLEAMFLNTKLITNNIEITKLPFYRVSNIYVIGYDDENRLNTFLHTPFQSIEQEELYPYDANGWIDNFMK